MHSATVLWVIVIIVQVHRKSTQALAFRLKRAAAVLLLWVRVRKTLAINRKIAPFNPISKRREVQIIADHDVNM